MSRPRRLKVIVEADGGSRGNPGVAGHGAVVREAATGEVLVERAEAIGVATNNVAEYSGLIAGLQAAADLGAVEVEVRMDSKLVVEQMSGRWQIKHPGLRPLAAQAAALARRFDTVRFTWVPRERNTRADALANAAMDGKPPPDLDLSVPPPSGSSVSGSSMSGLPAGSLLSGSLVAGSSVAELAPGSVAPLWADQDGLASWGLVSSGAATRLVLVRHGETGLTAQRRYSGRGDAELTERGVAQAQATAARVAELVTGPAVVVSSPLSRCVHTAQEIAARLGGAPVRLDEDLVECDFGEWEGLTLTEVRQRWPEQVEQWLTSPSTAPPGGESLGAVASRVRASVSRLLSEHPGETVVIVSHVTPIKLILCDALGAGETLLRRLFLDAAGISIVDARPDGDVTVRTINDTAHLTPLERRS